MKAVWDIELESRKGNGTSARYCVMAGTAEEAIQKAKKRAASDTKKEHKQWTPKYVVSVDRVRWVEIP